MSYPTILARYTSDGSEHISRRLDQARVDVVLTLGGDLLVLGAETEPDSETAPTAYLSRYDGTTLERLEHFSLGPSLSWESMQAATDGNTIFLARVECDLPDGCYNAGEVSLLLSAYDQQLDLLWEATHELPQLMPRLIDLEITADGSLLLLLDPYYGEAPSSAREYASDGSFKAQYDASSLGCTRCQALSRTPTGDTLVMGQPASGLATAIRRFDRSSWTQTALLEENADDKFHDFVATEAGFDLVGEAEELIPDSPSTAASALFARVSVNGDLVSRKTVGSDATERLLAVALDPGGNLYAAGITSYLAAGVEPSVFVTPWPE